MIKHFSVATKFNSVVIIFTLVVATAVVSYLTQQEYTHSKQRLLSENIASINLTGRAHELAVYFEDQELLQQSLTLLFKKKLLKYAAIYNHEPRLLIQQGLDTLERGPNFDQLRQYSNPRDQSVFSYDNNEEGTRYFDLMVPIYSPVNPDYKTLGKEDFMKILVNYSPDQNRYVMGYIRLGLNRQPLITQTLTYLFYLSLAALCIVLLSVLASLVVTRRITAPLGQLTKIAKRISEGEIDVNVPSNSSYEIKEVASSMNYMLKNVLAYQTKLKTSHEQLSLKVKERTEQLSDSNQQLQRAINDAISAKEAAEQASRAKSDFLATMSHEIRTPLNGVLGMTEMLSKTNLSREQQKFTNVILESGRALLEVINDILDFSKIEAGKLELHYTRFDLRRLIEEIINMFAGLAHNKGLALNYTIPAELNLMVEADITRLRQIISNLVSNAVKFTHEGEIHLSLTLVESDTERSRIRIEVADTGIGIDHNKLDQIFHAFSQADSSTTRKFGGTGLGLAITKQLIELMGGEIQVDSQPGKGTRFWFEVEMAANAINNEPSTSQLNLLRQLNILVLEPSDHQIREIISYWKIHCDSVDSVAAFKELFTQKLPQQNRYNLLVLDTALLTDHEDDLAVFLETNSTEQDLRMIVIESPKHSLEKNLSQTVKSSVTLRQPLHQSELYNTIVTMVSENTPSNPPMNGAVSKRPRDAVFTAKVLLAEDTVVNQQVAITMLEWLGCEVVLANNGLQAAELFAAGEYDVVLMDCQMPVMDGYAATARIRNKEGFSNVTKNPSQATHTPIIALTANALEGEREKCLAAGMDDFLTKPFLQEDIEAKLLHWLPENRIHAHSPTHSVEKKACTRRQPATTPSSANHSDDQRIISINRKSLDDLHAIQSPTGSNIIEAVISAYIRESALLLEGLRQAEQDNDPTELYKAAHALKSSSSNVGALRLADFCKTLEKIGRGGSITGATELLNSIVAEYPNVIEQLEEELNNENGKQASA